VHRQNFQQIKQSEGEPLTHYVARLRSQATLCDFHITCSRQGCGSLESYTKDMIATQMISGVLNKEHQSKVLANATTCKTFQEKYDMLIGLETTDNRQLDQ